MEYKLSNKNMPLLDHLFPNKGDLGDVLIVDQDHNESEINKFINTKEYLAGNSSYQKNQIKQRSQNAYGNRVKDVQQQQGIWSVNKIPPNNQTKTNNQRPVTDKKYYGLNKYKLNSSNTIWSSSSIKYGVSGDDS